MVTIARELGIVIEVAEVSTQLAEMMPFCGTEHAVEFDEYSSRVFKITRPPYFGITGSVFHHPAMGKIPARQSLELRNASASEYLYRWLLAKELWLDDPRLESVILWRDLTVSFCVSQPIYHGRPAEAREIEAAFLDAGWENKQKLAGRVVFYHPEKDVLAIDAESSNCYIHEGQFMPFVVVLCKPSETLRDLLRLTFF